MASEVKLLWLDQRVGGVCRVMSSLVLWLGPEGAGGAVVWGFEVKGSMKEAVGAQLVVTE